MGLLLVIAGAAFALLFVLNALIQTVRRQARLGFWQTALAFLAALLPLAGLVTNTLNGMTVPLGRGTGPLSGTFARSPLFMPHRLTLIIAAVLIVISLLVMLLELRRPERLKGSRGVFGIGVGILLIASVFAVPTLSENVLQPALATPTPIVVAAVVQQQTATRTPASTVQSSATATLTPSPTATQTRIRPSTTPTPTRFRFATRTPEPTATLPNPCLALTNYNVNLRTEPNLESEVLAQIPYNTTITLFGRDADSLWWFTEYEDQGGWLKGEFLNVSDSCNDLPIRR